MAPVWATVVPRATRLRNLVPSCWRGVAWRAPVDGMAPFPVPAPGRGWDTKAGRGGRGSRTGSATVRRGTCHLVGMEVSIRSPLPLRMMSRSRLFLALVAIAALLVVPLLLLRGRAPEMIPDRARGDVEEALAGMAVDDMPLTAEGYLATDRPWRAARTMRAYAERVDPVPADRRVLAAVAEAGWGGWLEAHRLLEGIPALDTHANGIGLYLLARARDEAGNAGDAVEAYRSFLALSPPAGEMEGEREAARLRLGLALLRAGDREAAARELNRAAERAGSAAVWLPLLQADALAQAGDTAAVRAAVAGYEAGLFGPRQLSDGAIDDAARRHGLSGGRLCGRRPDLGSVPIPLPAWYPRAAVHLLGRPRERGRRRFRGSRGAVPIGS
jgi:hypothetical protein